MCTKFFQFVQKLDMLKQGTLVQQTNIDKNSVQIYKLVLKKF